MKRKLAPQMSASTPRRVTSTRLIGFCTVRSILTDYSCHDRNMNRSAKTAGSLRRLAGKCGKRLSEPPNRDLRVSGKGATARCSVSQVCRVRNSVPRFVPRWMHREAEEEAACSANGDDENAARRRLGAEIASEFVARDTRAPLRQLSCRRRSA